MLLSLVLSLAPQAKLAALWHMPKDTYYTCHSSAETVSFSGAGIPIALTWSVAPAWQGLANARCSVNVDWLTEQMIKYFSTSSSCLGRRGKEQSQAKCIKNQGEVTWRKKRKAGKKVGDLVSLGASLSITRSTQNSWTYPHPLPFIWMHFFFSRNSRLSFFVIISNNLSLQK